MNADTTAFLCALVRPCMRESPTQVRTLQSARYGRKQSKSLDFQKNALHKLYITRSNNFQKKIQVFIFFNIQRKSLLSFQWHGGAILPIPENSQVLSIVLPPQLSLLQNSILSSKSIPKADSPSAGQEFTCLLWNTAGPLQRSYKSNNRPHLGELNSFHTFTPISYPF